MSMLGSMFDLVVANEARTAQRETQRQNASRLAMSTHRLDTTGVGKYTVTDPLIFDVVFLEAPMMVCGAAVVTALTPEWYPPLAGAVVLRWQVNSKGHYTGAFIGLNVSIEAAENSYADFPELQMQHHLLFMGIGFKDLGPEVSTEAQLLAPRATGYGGM